jgi:hypothetical protein
VTDSNYEAPINTDNNIYEEFDFRFDEKIEAENKINTIRSSDIVNKREQNFNYQSMKYVPHSPRKDIMKTDHRNSQKFPQEMLVTKSVEVKTADLQRDIDVKVEIVDFPNESKYEEITDLYGKSI